MTGFPGSTKLEFVYRRLIASEKKRVLSPLRMEFESVGGVEFAYIHGSFVEREAFRDVDVAVWIQEPGRAWFYTVDFSAELEVKLRIPVGIQVLNEATLPFKHQVFAEGRLLFSVDEKLVFRVIVETLREYADMRRLRAREALEEILTDRALSRHVNGPRLLRPSVSVDETQRYVQA